VLASGSVDKSVRTWNPDNAKDAKSLGNHGASVYGVAFSPNGKLLASCAFDGTIKVWDLEGGKELKSFSTGPEKGPKDGVLQVAWGADNKTLYACGFDKYLHVWDALEGKELEHYGPAPDDLYGLAVSKDGKNLAMGTDEGTVKFWDVAAEKVLWTLTAHKAPVWALALSPKGDIFYFADTVGRRIYRYDLDRQSGRLSDRRLFLEFTPEQGQPDGMTVDEEGGLWVCHWGGWGVTRYLPGGRTSMRIDLPAPNVTSCAFGGEDLRTLYITTAKDDMTPADAAKAPLAGGLFAARPGPRGMLEPIFKG